MSGERPRYFANRLTTDVFNSSFDLKEVKLSNGKTVNYDSNRLLYDGQELGRDYRRPPCLIGRRIVTATNNRLGQIVEVVDLDEVEASGNWLPREVARGVGYFNVVVKCEPASGKLWYSPEDTPVIMREGAAMLELPADTFVEDLEVLRDHYVVLLSLSGGNTFEDEDYNTGSQAFTVYHRKSKSRIHFQAMFSLFELSGSVRLRKNTWLVIGCEHGELWFWIVSGKTASASKTLRFEALKEAADRSYIRPVASLKEDGRVNIYLAW